MVQIDLDDRVITRAAAAMQAAWPEPTALARLEDESDETYVARCATRWILEHVAAHEADTAAHQARTRRLAELGAELGLTP